MLQELAENIWVAAAPQRFLGLQIGTRMTIVRYNGGKLFLHSPVPLTQELRQNLLGYASTDDGSRTTKRSSLWLA